MCTEFFPWGSPKVCSLVSQSRSWAFRLRCYLAWAPPLRPSFPLLGLPSYGCHAGLYLIFTGALWKGVFVLLWGVLVISAADNIIRPWVVSGKVELHPLVLLFFILGGVEAFGFIGLFLGPVVASVLAVLYHDVSRGTAVGE